MTRCFSATSRSALPAESGLAPVSIVDRADVPHLPFKPNLFLNLLLGLGLGLAAGMAGAIGLEFINDTIKSREDVRKKLSLPCLGAVPRTPAKDAFVDDLKNPTSVISEAYSAIVAALRFSTESGMPKVLLLTSTRVGRGQIFIGARACAEFRAPRQVGSSNRWRLTQAGVQGGERGRRPQQAPDDRGQGRGPCRRDPAHQPVAAAERTGSAEPGGPACRLAGSARSSREASERFELVVIDGPPTLGLADAPLARGGGGRSFVRH